MSLCAVDKDSAFFSRQDLVSSKSAIIVAQGFLVGRMLLYPRFASFFLSFSFSLLLVRLDCSSSNSRTGHLSDPRVLR